jgi:hypothetical protein
MLTGTFSINDTLVKILFDSGVTHSFISESLVEKLSLSGLWVSELVAELRSRRRV